MVRSGRWWAITKASVLGAMLFVSVASLSQVTRIHTVTVLPVSCTGGVGSQFTDKVVLIVNNVGVEYTCIAPNTWMPTSTQGISAHFADHPSNPVLSPTGGETLTAFGNVVKVGATYHMYYMYLNGNQMIGHATSSDGITWTKDVANNPVLDKAGSGTWDNTAVGVPTVWFENGTYNMYYRGQGTGDGKQRSGFATSSTGVAFTRTAGNFCAAPANSGNGCVLDIGYVNGGTEPQEVYGVIKVGSTYYLGTDNPGGATRAAGVATTTDLIHVTKDAANPLFTGGRYDQGFFKFGNYYYDILPHYLAGSNLNAELELYRSPTMPFYASTRTYLGVIKQQAGGNGSSGNWNSYALDTPFVLTDDVTRSTFNLTSGDLWMYYAGTADSAHTNFFTGLAIAAQGLQIQQDTFAALPNGGTLVGPLILLNGAGSNGYLQVNGANGIWINNPGAFVFWAGRAQLSSPADGQFLIQNHASTQNVNISVPGLFSALPTCNAAAEGSRGSVTDSTTATYGATISGNGSNHVAAYCNGTNWVVD